VFSFLNRKHGGGGGGLIKALSALFLLRSWVCAALAAQEHGHFFAEPGAN
jgi:hypothetical protein